MMFTILLRSKTSSSGLIICSASRINLLFLSQNTHSSASSNTGASRHQCHRLCHRVHFPERGQPRSVNFLHPTAPSLSILILLIPVRPPVTLLLVENIPR